MVRIGLRLYLQPGRIEVFINMKRQDGAYERHICVIDTGSPVLFLPQQLISILDYRLTERGSFTIEQAGIAQQAFTATEAFITINLEDEQGHITEDFEVRVWFAKTDKYLVGFDGVLDRAVLHVDMPQLTGYLEILWILYPL